MADKELGEARVPNRTSVSCAQGHGPHRVRGRGLSESSRRMTGCGCGGGGARAKGTPMTKGQKRGGLAIAKER